MAEEPNPRSERRRRVIRSAGSAAGRGSVGVLNWIANLILKVVVPVAVALALLWGSLYYWQVLRPEWARNQKPIEVPKLTKVEIDKANLDCGLRMGWEDGSSDETRLFALIAAKNLSEPSRMNTSLCDISRKFWTLRAPGNAIKFIFRPTNEVDYFSGWSADQLLQYNKLKEDFLQHLQNPQTLLEKHPWLRCVTHYKRVTYPWLFPWPDKKLDTVMRLVYRAPTGEQYYCSK